MNQVSRTDEGQRGSAFFVVLILSLVSVVMVGVFMKTSIDRMRGVEVQAMENATYNAAESGLNMVIEEVWRTYKETKAFKRIAVLNSLDGKNAEKDRIAHTGLRLDPCTFDVFVREVRAVGSDYADVEIVCTAQSARTTKTLMAVVRFGRQSSHIFDHAYFINNFGWLWGSSITMHGDVRSNGNFSTKDALVNGDVLASENPEIGAAGTVEGGSRHQSIADYNATAPANARPTNPSAPTEDLNSNGVLDEGEDANGNGVLDEYYRKGGYDGESELLPSQAAVEMPYLGDLEYYRNLAVAEGGTLSQGGTTVVDAVLGDVVGEKDSILLVGTDANPIVLDGPVVVESDVVLRGVITGQGTIYAGRNVHIIGDLKYADGPSWEKPVYDGDELWKVNKTKDMVGLAAKGSIVIGNYTTSDWKTTLSKYQTPPFTVPYPVDPTDDVNGYASYEVDGVPWFDGNYTSYDGGKKDNGSGGTTDRRFYESSFSDADIIANSQAGYVTRVDAITYTNHLYTGRVGATTFNGTIVARDEGIVYSTKLIVNYDIRVRGNGYEQIDIYLPREPSYQVLYWGEGCAEEPVKEVEEEVEEEVGS
jgi:hypothetical protein